VPLVDSDISLDLYITANSPGEIAGWVAPVVREIRSRIWKCRITLVILPCQYASGSELSLGASCGVDRCLRIGDLHGLAAAGKKLVLRMGGDFFFSVYLSRKLASPLWAYSTRPSWGRFVERFFVPDEVSARRFAASGFPSDRYEMIGNLVLDSVVLNESEEETRALLGLSADEPVISCLTGSRPIEYCRGVPFFGSIASLVTEKFPDHRVLFPLAPTVREDLLQNALRDAGVEWKGETRVHAVSLGGGRWGTVVRDRTLEALSCSRLAIAVPGTNNMQAAALYVPFVMVLPLDRADEYPLDGLPGILPLWLPGVKKFKRGFIMRLNERTDFVSLPNKMAGRMIAPEIRGLFNVEDVADKVINLLGSPDELQSIQRAFWELTHERGASARLAERVAEWAKKAGKT
jgi:lipid-A-disaccharide synthase